MSCEVLRMVAAPGLKPQINLTVPLPCTQELRKDHCELVPSVYVRLASWFFFKSGSIQLFATRPLTIHFMFKASLQDWVRQNRLS